MDASQPKQPPTNGKLQVPASLQTQLQAFRQKVWWLKLTEALAIALFSVAIAYLAVFALDRFGDTPAVVRLGGFLAALVGCAMVPWFCHRWIYSRRTPKQLARLLRHKMPQVGDHLLGVIELAEDQSEQARSKTLVAAAINQVAEDAKHRDFATATPASKRPLWGTLAAVCLAGAIGLLAIFPAAATNAWARFARPWHATPRYTFAAVKPLPTELVVAHGEPFKLPVTLDSSSEWKPEKAAARIGKQRPITAPLSDGGYELAMPSQIAPDAMIVKVGDAKHQVNIQPTLRPELTALSAQVTLPEYLGRKEPIEKDVRGGALSLVKGSRASFVATVSRELTSATVDGEPAAPSGASIPTGEQLIEVTQKREFAWVDHHSLSGIEPFALSISAVDDEEPTLIIEGLPQRKVLLETDLVNFQVRARDDFGVQQIGMTWHGLPMAVAKPAEGERLLAAGNHEAELLSAQGVFCAKSLGIEPQPVEVRLFVEDYFPDRGRLYSSPHIFYILSPDQHAIWMTEQLSKWHRQALEVRDRELQLYEENRQLREMTPEELDRPEVRRRIEKQAAAEQSNGHRLRRLTAAGGELVREASRNPEIGVGHLERWAEMLGLLDDISANRMPSVADLLKKSSQAAKLAASKKAKSPPTAGQVRDTASGAGSKPDPSSKPKPTVPQIADRESSQLGPQDPVEPSDTKKKSSKGKFTLPVTTVMGKAKKPAACPAGKKLDEAVTEQENLLAEFEKIANELNEVLANLEGSTLVKRLKAASRKQYQIAGRVGDEIAAAFGRQPMAAKDSTKQVFKQLTKQEDESTQDVSYIMDDMAAYFERRQMMRFKLVLDEMREQDIIGSLRTLGEDIPKKQGLAIAQAEYWSDSMDRWADDLVDPACSGCCPGGKSPDSLPPSIVLEAMQILEAEVALREETRVAEQAKTAVDSKARLAEAERLASAQDALQERTEVLYDRILELKDAKMHFGKELKLLSAVANVMDEATSILGKPETGPPAIAAETEAIELLLASKKINPNGGGGGGGSSPGSGGGGDTDTPAIALLGSGVNEKEVREERDVVQSTGETGETLPAEFRAGLDEYFSRLEQGGGSSTEVLP